MGERRGSPARGSGPTTAADEPGATAGSVEQPLRVAVIGISESEICGVRDHSRLLAAAMEQEGLAVSVHWLDRHRGSIRTAWAEVKAWSDRLEADLREDRPAAIVLVYSVFAYSHRGIPLFAPAVLKALRRSRIPVIGMLHEVAYPWNQGGWRGKVWSLTQRATLFSVLRSVRAVVVTSDFQGEWVASRRWLPRRPLAVAPVFSNLPSPSADVTARADDQLIGVFGYSYQGVAADVVLDALGHLRTAGLRPRLLLLGSPGAASPAGEDWLRRAGERGLRDTLTFSGPLPAQELSDGLAGCTLLLFPDRSGPSSRKGSLAAALASGRPVIAIDGPRTWAELVAAGAVRLVPAEARALAEAARGLLCDGTLADALGARGRAFADTRMGLAVTSGAVLRFLDEIAGLRRGHPHRRAPLHAEAASS